MDKITPMMQQYIEQKEKWTDCIMFFRLGDFYEMFFDDAITASRELELALTGRDCGLDERAPMCGIPYHAADSYISKLVAHGYKVAICEQVEDPSIAKGIVRREVIKVVTPGTITDLAGLDEKNNNYIASVFQISTFFGIAFADITTGILDASMLIIGNTQGKLADEIAKRDPSEIICNEIFLSSDAYKRISQRSNTLFTVRPESSFTNETFLNYYPEHETQNHIWTHAVGALIEYIRQTQTSVPSHLKNINVYTIEEYMILDTVARKNLEITETIRDRSKKGSLLWVIDKTHTAMGGRLLRRWIEQPLISEVEILYRLDAVAETKDKFINRQEIKEALSGIHDIERLTGKISLFSVNARDFIALRNSIKKLPALKDTLQNLKSPLWQDIYQRFDILADIHDLIENSIDDDAPLGIKEGGIIKIGFNDEVDHLKSASTDGKKWLMQYESDEREKTGIKNLKVKYTNNFGFLIEVSNSNANNVPSYFVRRQTLVNCERFITEDLTKMEETILGAEQKLTQLEYDVFCEIREKISQSISRLFEVSSILSSIDAITSLSEVSDRENYCRPLVDTSDVIDIVDGRHPVVEKVLGQGNFIPNSTLINQTNQQLLLITGPNMSGKSTYMRQVAQIVLLAQIGCFVPAASAHIGIVDKIFTRVGASDDLSSGQSTFMVEMSEVANILTNATSRSLLILDEIGRGTSTYDGLSIAWAVMEYIASKENLGCRTLFATHYHELTDLEATLDGIRNYHVDVDEVNGDIVFLHKISEGGCDDSYGIDVAKLAGVPEKVVQRAKEILSILEKDHLKDKLRIRKSLKIMDGQVDIFTSSLSLYNTQGIIDELKLIDVQKMTPLDAMNLLYDLSNKAKKVKIE
ncbi:MAG: DNA mismatch repair protein MutS [Saccharofermentanales bacterium]